MKLYYFPSPNGRKPCGVAKHLGLPIELVSVDLASGEQKTPEFLAINPNGKVPVLQDGETVVWESPSIMLYLAHKAGSALWPSDPLKQAEVVKWISWDTAHFSRHGSRLYWERYIKPNFGIGESNPEEIEEATNFFHQFAEVLNTHLKDRDYLLGDQLSIADFSIDSILHVAEEAQLPFQKYDAIKRWHARMMELPAWREPYPA